MRQRNQMCVHQFYHTMHWRPRAELTFVVDLAVAVDVGLANHLVDLLVRQLLAQVGHHVAQLGGRNEAVAVLVEYSERLSDLLFAVGVLHFARHHREELGEVDGAIACADCGAKYDVRTTLVLNSGEPCRSIDICGTDERTANEAVRASVSHCTSMINYRPHTRWIRRVSVFLSGVHYEHVWQCVRYATNVRYDRVVVLSRNARETHMMTRFF